MSLFRRRRSTPPAPDAAVYPVAGTRQRRLLVCDDNNTVTQLLEMLFTREGWAVDVVASGEECLRRLTEIRPDVLLLDQQLDGGMDGIDTARILRREGFDRPVLLFSAYLDDASRAAARRLDLVPISKVDFPAVVRHVEAAYSAQAPTTTTKRSAQRLP